MSRRQAAVATVEVPVPAEPTGFSERTYELLAQLDQVRARLERAVDEADAENERGNDDERGRK